VHPLLPEVIRAGDRGPLGARGSEIESLRPEGGRRNTSSGDEQHVGKDSGGGKLPLRGEARADGPGSGAGVQDLHSRSGDPDYGSADEEEPVPGGGDH